MSLKKRVFLEVKKFFGERFELQSDRGDIGGIIESMSKATEFKGTNLWILIFAIFTASIGLNVNSTAVIIGAMLISPLMGPIMGIGLGVGIMDFDLIKKSYRNFLVAVGISVLTSFIYFSISPIRDAQSELLARTTPTIYDVFVALFGGLAGMVAATRKDKNLTVVPGVAIATALMPPLCTAGYGLATGNFYYFGGAFYLFLINSVFISLATYFMVKFLQFPRKTFLDRRREQRIKRYIIALVIVTVLPSVYFAYHIVKRGIFERNAKEYISVELKFANTQMISQDINYSRKGNKIEVVLIGDFIEEEQLDIVEEKLARYGLDGAELVVKQGFSKKENNFDVNVLRAGVIEDLYKTAETEIKNKDERIRFLERELSSYQQAEAASREIAPELKAINSSVTEFAVNRVILSQLQEENTYDTLFMSYVRFSQRPDKAEKTRLENWLKARLKTDNLQLIVRE
ncbi:MAG: DUF389 domain-containing protein [Cyclobacteriaceae bacterium]|nr:DUF389 domain-containing protein [Cyclobacteriaceae bacterium]MCH8514945.1 DUF389 domain-containing protein [Cyclobacteriaceae bacterium]